MTGTTEKDLLIEFRDELAALCCSTVVRGDYNNTKYQYFQEQLLNSHINGMQKFLNSNEDAIINTLLVLLNSNTEQIELVTDVKDVENLEKENTENLSIFIVMRTTELFDMSVPLRNQINILFLPGFVTIESLVKLVNNGLTDLFELFIKSAGSSYPPKSINKTRQMLSEISRSLQNVEDIVEIPTIISDVHQIIKDIILRGATLDNYTTFLSEQQINDPRFLNNLQRYENTVQRNCKKLLSFEYSGQFDSMASELRALSQIEAALSATISQLKSAEFQIVLAILRTSNRLHSQSSMTFDTELPEKLTAVRGCIKFLSSIQINALITAKNWDLLSEVLNVIRISLRKFRHSDYPIANFINLINNLTKLLFEQITKLLPYPFEIDKDLLEATIKNTIDILNQWDIVLKENITQMREVVRRNNINLKISLLFEFNPEPIKKFLKDVLKTRIYYDIFTTVLHNIAYNNYGSDIEFLFEPLHNFKIKDISTISAWNTVYDVYNARLIAVETKLMEILGQTLNNLPFKKLVAEILKFKPLVKFSPRVKAKIRDWQHVFLKSAIEEAVALQRRVDSDNSSKEAFEVTYFPPISSKVLEFKQVNERLNTVLSQIESLLGPNWSEHPDGQVLSSKALDIKVRTTTDSLVKSWLDNVAENKYDILSLPVLRLAGNNEGKLSMELNCDSSLLDLTAEVRNLLHMSVRVPSHILRVSSEYRAVSKSAAHILELYTTFVFFFNQMSKYKYISFLLKTETDNIWELFGSLLHTSWRTLLSQPWANKEQESAVASLENLIYEAIERFGIFECFEGHISEKLEQLELVSLNFATYSQKRSELQDVLERISSIYPIQLEPYLHFLNSLLIKSIVNRSSVALKNLNFMKDIITIRYEKNKIYSLPSISQLKRTWLLSVESIYQDAVDRELLCNIGSIEKCYINASTLFKFLQKPMTEAVEKILEVTNDITNYIARWKHNEFLWDFTEQDIDAKIDNCLSNAVVLLENLLKAKSALTPLQNFQLSTAKIKFKPQNAYTFVIARFEYWETYISERVASLYLKTVIPLQRSMNEKLDKLDRLSLNTASFDNILSVVNLITIVRKEFGEKEQLCQLCNRTQNILYKVHFKFPEDFTYSDHLGNVLEMLTQSFQKKISLLQLNSAAIQKKLNYELDRNEEMVKELNKKWEHQRVKLNELLPNEVLKTIGDFENLFHEYRDRALAISEAAKILLIPIAKPVELESILTDISSYRDYWTDIEGFWQKTGSVYKQEWRNVNIDDSLRELRKLLVNEADGSPIFRQFSAFKKLSAKVEMVLDYVDVLQQLKDDSLKPRHWEHIFEVLTLGSYQNACISSLSFTFDSVIELDLRSNKAFLQKVVATAQKEFVIEKALSRIQLFWSKCHLQTKLYEGKFKIIREWEVLKSAAKEDLDELLSMKGSHYYKSFKIECSEWERKLSQISDILFAWMELQLSWLSLYDILGKSKDVRGILPLECSKFQRVTAEYEANTTRALELKNLLEILNIPDFLKTLQRLSSSLRLINSSLNDFLEKQRKFYPRFYFLGNEDLMKLIGSGSDVVKLSTFIRKLYGNIVELIVSPDSIKGIVSIEGEELLFVSPIISESEQPVSEVLKKLDEEIHNTLSSRLYHLIKQLDDKKLPAFDCEPFQLQLLAYQIYMTSAIEKGIESNDFSLLHDELKERATTLATQAKLPGNALKSKISENLLIEVIHYINIVNILSASKTNISCPLYWSQTPKYLCELSHSDELCSLRVSQCNFEVCYGFEYIGVPERLIYTPLLVHGFASLMGSLTQRLGGCFFGPAGTGKTETVKALGQNLGKLVVVFNCDDLFDFQIMTRLLMGIGQIGAWGCFDEFNRLDETVLSSISSNIEVIQRGLLNNESSIQLANGVSPLHKDTALFITLNPDYVGRSELPENLKTKFREFSIQFPEIELITEAILQIMGFKNVKELASQFLAVFNDLQLKASPQKHYDFSLRAMKRVLHLCSDLIKQKVYNEASVAAIVDCMRRIILPTLAFQDEDLFHSSMLEHFPYSEDSEIAVDPISECLKSVAIHEGLDCSMEFFKKCQQFYHMQMVQQSIILVGAAGIGKSYVWKTALSSMKRLTGVDNTVYIIDTKALSKETLYGSLNKATLEWSDGVFTSIIRRIYENNNPIPKKEMIWIVFDSDLDPSYAECLNSVLDDNKVLTLSNGERLHIPLNVRIVFETDSVGYATPATISRCGLIWFSKCTFDPFQSFKYSISKSFQRLEKATTLSAEFLSSIEKQIYCHLNEEVFSKVSAASAALYHIMALDMGSAATIMADKLSAFFIERSELLQNANKVDLKPAIFLKIQEVVLDTLAAGCSTKECLQFSKLIQKELTDDGTEENVEISDVMFSAESLAPISYSSMVPKISLEPEDIMKHDIIITTVDTIKLEALVLELLSSKRGVILCGPPGAGKTMILNNLFNKLPTYQLISMNFSKHTTVANVLRTIERYTKYVSRSDDYMLVPQLQDKKLVFFFDEINLPQNDKYGSQAVILFLRQLAEKRGFWKVPENKWVVIEDIQIVGACNPSTDLGRISLTNRFVRHTAVLYVDYPTLESLKYIYGAYFEAALCLLPQFKTLSKFFSEASVSLYVDCKESFKAASQIHYVFSPRDLTRLVRGFYAHILDGSRQDLISLIKLWSYEIWRIFGDKLASQEERNIFGGILEKIIASFFPLQEGATLDTANLLFSDWLNLEYMEVQREEFKTFVNHRFRTFCEEELDSALIVHDDMLDHILRIDRILKQVQGHGMLIGPSRTGKTTMLKFVAWVNGHRIMQPRIHRNYTLEDFDNFLRDVLLKCTVEEKNICLIIDESSILEASFLERMNTLLANADIPDLFQGEHYDNLMNRLLHKVNSFGFLIDTEQEVYRWFTQEIAKKLHVVFTINNPKASSSLISSPALLNRCVIDWVGDWSAATYSSVATEMIRTLPFNHDGHQEATGTTSTNLQATISHIVASFDEYFYENSGEVERSPCHFIDTLKSLTQRFVSRQQYLQENHAFMTNGLDKISESVLKVKELNNILSQKRELLTSKEKEARKTLDSLLMQQNESERKQEATEEIKKILVVQETEASKRHEQVKNNLASIEPTIIEAQRGVKNIKKQQLTEIRSMNNPPIAVKTIMEAVCLILGYEFVTWRDIQLFIRRDDFIFEIVHYNTESMMTNLIKDRIENEYLNRSDFTFETINRASKACGPLFQWVYAQIKYGEILQEIHPLRQEAAKLDDARLRAKARLMAAEEMVIDLQKNIEESKTNYSSLIRDVEVIKTQMERVEVSLERSTKLVQSLMTEKERWLKNISDSKNANNELIGNSLLSAIYENYFGQLNERERLSNITYLFTLMKESFIKFDMNYTYLGDRVEPQQKIQWTNVGLPNDEFYLENMSILETSDWNVPYILDASASVVNVLSSIYKNKFVKLSFLEPGFVKRLENAVKFGSIVLIEDGEFYDPIISGLISKEYKKIGGRQTVHIGSHEIEVASEFKLFIHSRDSTALIVPALRAHTRLINFSINKGSIEMQTIRAVLHEERPDVQQKREELFRLNGEYRVSLQNLEVKLLKELNNSEGNILENDELINTLENLKLESSEIEKKLRETENVIINFNALVEQYAVLGKHSVLLFSILEYLGTKHWFYDIPVWQYMRCLKSVFNTVSSNSEFSSRVDELLWQLYSNVYKTFSWSLDEKTGNIFGLVLYMSYNFSKQSVSFNETFDGVLTLIADELDVSSFEKKLALLKASCPIEISDLLDVVQDQPYKSLVNVFQREFVTDKKINDLILSNGSYPLIIGGERYADGTYRITNLAEGQNREVEVIPLGSEESTNFAEKELLRCQNEGGWILLQNLQMSLPWVGSYLAKCIDNFMMNNEGNKDNAFRIFMTCNISAHELPLPLLNASYKYLFEEKSAIKDTFMALWTDNTYEAKSKCIERSSVYYRFLLTWFHTLIISRNRLAPIGFTKKYDFNNYDYETCLSYMNHLLTKQDSVQRNTLCGMLQFYVTRITYGGKIDNPEDYKTLETISHKIFNYSGSLEDAFTMLNDNISPSTGNSETWEEQDVIALLKELKEPTDSPITWLGLPREAIQAYEKKLSAQIATETLDVYHAVNKNNS
ncbi:hypothetical protein KAFR_0G00690 [Kazachstania africana CBS 2517]|uniref:Dynein heavy chain, cytoplasmic n=1 Tax=Kazachstania africana (strain ATCC 22294 / BCRC 22015 / CBS 2517 / CECT 1963 / NBRC 1671 / NRRL Y-8276) TaxID=1071382 RepID=H2AXK2_KAZAF|nr:hypothetical protein KAFR_0G00690 [Kazachstania africana CBS 2517]CCF59102.1 hypothetical protein KAFR_0G00690 [Kazachstania africana CBS 2517]